MYSLKSISTLTGLTPETLRAWERRYGAITPQRDHNERRVYSQQDLDRLMLLAQLTRQGHAISKLAPLGESQLQDLQRATPQPASSVQHDFIVQILDSLKSYQVERTEQLLKRALIAYEPLIYVRDILLPALQAVGLLWHQGEISIAQEHWFSGCVKRIVLSMVNNIHQLYDERPAMLFATTRGEVHEFGILVSCLLAACQQYNCYYLGRDLPAGDIAEAVSYLKPEIVVLSLVITPPTTETVQEMARLSESLPKTMVWIGGEGASYLQQQQGLPASWVWLADIEQFYQRAAQWQRAKV